MMKKAVLLSLFLVLTAFFAFGCAEDAIEDAVVSAPPSSEDVTDITLTPFSPAETSAAQNAGKASVEVVSAVARAYSPDGQPTLYGAVEFKNTGTANAVVTNASFTFSVNGTEVKHEFEPVLSQYDVVAPGESSFVTLWLPNSSVSAGSAVTLTAELTCEAAANARTNIEVDNLFLADNYPGFTTMSGSLKNASPEEQSFLMVYVGFYDENGALLGVWYFTKNIRLDAGGGTNFVTRMENLPVNGLSATVKTMKTSAFGFNG